MWLLPALLERGTKANWGRKTEANERTTGTGQREAGTRGIHSNSMFVYQGDVVYL